LVLTFLLYLNVMKANANIKYSLFRSHSTYSPEAILAAGGAIAFGKKSGKNNDSLIKALENAQPVEPFTAEEWENVTRQLENDR
jgi:hypothetical protein